MLRSLKELVGYQLSATDGELGPVVDFLLDDERWVIRYGVVETAGPLREKRVLVSPVSFRESDWSNRRIHVSLTTEDIKNSPSIDVDKPVSRQHEKDPRRNHGYSRDWGFGGPWGMGALTGLFDRSGMDQGPLETPDASGDVHLRSAKEVRGYHIQGLDAEIGHLADFIVDDESWHVRYLVVDTSNWWVGKKVLVSPRWATRVSWQAKKVDLDLTRQEIKDCPEWTGSAGVNREYEVRLYDYYGRPAYWDEDGSHAASEDPR